MAATGELQQAERLLWEEAARAGVQPESADLAVERSSVARRATWALMEYYSRIPRVMRVPLGRLPSRVRFDESGSRVEAIGADGALGRWESDGRRLEATRPVWEIDDRHLSRVSASGAGGLMVVALPSGLRTFDAYTREWLTPPNADVTDVRMAQLTPDGAQVVVHDGAGGVKILDPRTWQVIATLIEPGGANGSMWFSNNGAFLAIEVRDPSGGSVRRWSTNDWSEILPPLTATRVQRVAFELPQNPAISNDGQWIAAGMGGNVAFWDADRPDDPVIALAHRASVNGIWFSDDASMAVTASPDGDIFVWDLPEARQFVRWRNGDRALCVDIRQDLGRVAVADDGGFVSVYELRPHPWNERFPVPPDGTLALAVNDDGGLIAWGGLRGVITVLDRSTGATKEIPAHDGLLTALRFLPGDRGLVSAGLDGAVRLWDVDTGAMLRTIDEGLPGLWSVAANAKNNRVIATGVQGEIFSWELGGSSREELTGGSARVPMADFSPSGERFVSVCVDGTAALWDTASNRVVHQLLGHTAAVRAAAFSPDGALVATGGDDHTIRFWDARNGNEAGIIEGLPRDVFRLVFHPSGRLLFCAGRGPEVMVFDVERRENLATLVAHERSVFAMEITPDGETIVTCGDDGWVAVWDLKQLRSYVTGNAHAWRAPEIGSDPH
jgi:WD40 repeat protein